MTTIPINYTPTKYDIELDRSREFWLEARTQSDDLTGYREEDI